MRKIQILGTGCAKCEKLAATTKEVADNLAIQYEIEKVTDLNQIMSYGVMTTPGLVIDGKVMAAGKIPGPAELEKMLR